MILKDGTRVAGVYDGLARVSFGEYRERYDHWREAKGAQYEMPPLLARVELVGDGIMSVGGGLFFGFSPQGVDFRSNEHAPVRTAAFSSFTVMVIRGGGRVESRTIERLARNGELPLVTALAMNTPDGERVVPLEQVDRAQSRAYPGLLVEPLAAFSPLNHPSYSTAVEIGALWVREYFARGLSLRVAPLKAGSFGPDFTVGFFQDEYGDRLYSMAFGLATVLPLGQRVGIEPRAGAGVLLGGGDGLLTWNFGAGLMLGLSSNSGIRADLTYHVPTGRWEGLDVISSFHVGPYWSIH